MAIELKTLTCPNCGAAVNCDPNTKTATCEFCGTVFDISEMYQEKADRERDDRQDEQIKKIMDDMDRNNDPMRQRRAMQQRRAMGKKSEAANTAKTIVIVIAVLLFVFSIFTTVFFSVFGQALMTFSSRTSATRENEKIELDPFDKISISYYGVSGSATARISDINNSAVKSIPMTTSDLENLSNGDTITIKYEENNVTEYKKDYVLTETEKTYVVEGLEEYVTDINDVSEEDFQILKDHAIEFAKNTIKDDDFNFQYDENSFEVYKIYTMVRKDNSEQQSEFIVSFDYYEEGEKKTGYFIANYSDMKILPSGECKIDYNPGVYIWSRESYGMFGFNLTSGHSTWESTYTDVYLNNKAEWNITEY